MKKTIITALLSLAITSAYADCEYQGEQYKVFDKLSMVDESVRNNPDFSIDATVIVLTCLPVANMDQIAAGSFAYNRIPAINDVWVPSEISYRWAGSDLKFDYKRSK